MMDLRVRKRKAAFPDADYICEKEETFLNLIYILTPKFFGKWEVLLLDPKITFIKQCADTGLIPDWINCHIYVSQQKLGIVTEEFPNLAPKQISVKDSFKEMVAKLKHPIEDKAMWMVYNAIGSNLEALDEALQQLDRECQSEVITRKQVQSVVNYTKRVYASDVVADFLLNRQWRYQHLNALVKELGESYAYNAIQSQVKKLLKAKNQYLHNEDTDNRLVDKIPAPLICYLYILFANSNSYHSLYVIMKSFDERSKSAVERIQYVNIQ